MDYHVPSVELAAQILKLLSRHKYKSCSLKDIAAKLDASPTTCLRVLRSLEREDFIRCNAETKKYSLGPYLIPLGNRAAELNGTVARASAEIQRIATETGLTTAVVQRWDDRLVYIASAQPPLGDYRLTRISISTGQQTPLNCGAHGRCFLAFDDESEWHRLLAAGIRPLTPNTITESQRFIEALREVRRTGCAVSHGEFHAGMSAVDVPVFDKTGNVELVISCMYVTSQLDAPRIAELVALLLATSRKLSEWSGYVAPWGDELPAQVVLA